MKTRHTILLSCVLAKQPRNRRFIFLALPYIAKNQNSLRVLCLGESSMFGVPFQYAATIPALVRKQLRHLYPDLDIEVVDLGASAINSNVIREMVPHFLSRCLEADSGAPFVFAREAGQRKP